MPIVDAHPHIYSPDRDTYPTIEEPWEPGEPASAEDLKKMMDAVGVDRAVFIQTSTFYGHDNQYIMDSAKEHAAWACGVVTLDPDDKSHLEVLEDGVENYNIRGMRGTTDSLNRIATPGVYRLWTKAMELGIPVNCMVMDDLDRVPEIERIAQDLGDLKIVIDHCFMLNTRHRTEETLVALERLAQLPNIYAKLTPGTHGSYRVYPYVDMHDPLKRVIEAFSPGRCVWGSNFPNTLWSKGASYAQNLRLFVKELGLSLPDKADILGVTAMSLWFPQEQEKEEQFNRQQHERTERESIEAQEDNEAPDDDDEEPEGEKGHVAEITQMADLIAAQGNVEGPILDDVDSVELAAILDAATELNAVLDTLDFPSKPAKSETEPVVAERADLPQDDDETQPETVNVEELLAAQNYTPIDNEEIGESDTDVTDVASDVEAQLAAALGSITEELEIDIEDLDEDETENEEETEEAVTLNVEDLLAAQDLISTVEEQKPDDPQEDSITEIAADVQAQLDAALGSISEIPEIETPEVEPDEPEPGSPTIDVTKLLAEQSKSPAAKDQIDEIEPVAMTEDSTAGEDEQGEEFDLSSIIEEAGKLNAALESVEDGSTEVKSASAEKIDPELVQPATGSNADVVVDVEELVASQDYTPIKTDEIGKAKPAQESEDESVDGEQMDLSAVMDVANQLNSMLESVEDIAANINDLASDAEDIDDASERPSA